MEEIFHFWEYWLSFEDANRVPRNSYAIEFKRQNWCHIRTENPRVGNAISVPATIKFPSQIKVAKKLDQHFRGFRKLTKMANGLRGFPKRPNRAGFLRAPRRCHSRVLSLACKIAANNDPALNRCNASQLMRNGRILRGHDWTRSSKLQISTFYNAIKAMGAIWGGASIARVFCRHPISCPLPNRHISCFSVRVLAALPPVVTHA